MILEVVSAGVEKRRVIPHQTIAGDKAHARCNAIGRKLLADGLVEKCGKLLVVQSLLLDGGNFAAQLVGGDIKELGMLLKDARIRKRTPVCREAHRVLVLRVVGLGMENLLLAAKGYGIVCLEKLAGNVVDRAVFMRHGPAGKGLAGNFELGLVGHHVVVALKRSARLCGLDVLGVGYAVTVVVNDGMGIPLGINRRIRINGCVSREGLLDTIGILIEPTKERYAAGIGGVRKSAGRNGIIAGLLRRCVVNLVAAHDNGALVGTRTVGKGGVIVVERYGNLGKRHPNVLFAVRRSVLYLVGVVAARQGLCGELGL